MDERDVDELLGIVGPRPAPRVHLHPAGQAVVHEGRLDPFQAAALFGGWLVIDQGRASDAGC